MLVARSNQNYKSSTVGVELKTLCIAKIDNFPELDDAGKMLDIISRNKANAEGTQAPSVPQHESWQNICP